MSLMKDIKDFHERYEMEYTGEPRVLPYDLFQFRIEFMKEEMIEYINASDFKKGNMADQLDALVDLTYIILGTAYLQGFDFDEAWRRVHAANMKKVKGVSKRSDQYDVIKPDGWVAPDLTDLVQVQQRDLFDDNNS